MADNGFKFMPPGRKQKDNDVILELVKNDEYILQQLINLNKEVEELKNRTIFGMLSNLLKLIGLKS